MGRTDGKQGSGGGRAQSSASKAASKRKAAPPVAQALSATALAQVTETVLAALEAKSKQKRRKRRASKRRESSSSESSTPTESSGDDDPDKPSTSGKAAKRGGKAAGGGKKGKVGSSSLGQITSAITVEVEEKRLKPPPKKRPTPSSASRQSKSALAAGGANGGLETEPHTTPASTERLHGEDDVNNDPLSPTDAQLPTQKTTSAPRKSAAKSPDVMDSDGAPLTPSVGDVGTPQEGASAASSRRKTRRGTSRPAAAPKPLSYCGEVPLAHLPRSFVLPSTLADKHELEAFTVLGETTEDSDLALLAPERSVLPDVDNLDGLINLSRLTQAERYLYVRRLISAAQWNPALRANVRMCMLVNARSCTDIFYLLLRSFDVSLLLQQKTPVDNFLTLIYNYLEILFMQRWFLMRPGSLTINELTFYGQRGENFKKYARYVELFFVRPKQFYEALDEILQAGVVSGQSVASLVLAKFAETETNLQAWFTMQLRANMRASSSRRVQMDMIPDASKKWIAQDDEDVSQLLANYWRSYNDARSTETAHWVDEFPAEQMMDPVEFSKLLHQCHSAIYRKIYTNKALSVSARRVGIHLSAEVKCSEVISVAGTNDEVTALAHQLGRLDIDKAVLELASARAEQWNAKFQFVRFGDDDDSSTAITLQLPIGNTAEFKEHLLSVVYAQVVAAQQTRGQEVLCVIQRVFNYVGCQPAARVVDAASAVAAEEAEDALLPTAAVDAPPSAAVGATSIPTVDETVAVDGSQSTVALTGSAVKHVRAAALAITPTRLVSLTARESAMWATRSMCHFWEQPPPSSRHGGKTMLFYDETTHDLQELRGQLHKELTSARRAGAHCVDNDVATALLHETMEAYSSVRPLDVVVTVADGYWQPTVAALEHYSPIQLTDSRLNPVCLADVRCVAGFSLVGEHRVLVVAFRPSGIVLTPHGLGAHCTIVILGCLDDAGALMQAFVAAQVQLARTLCKSALELEQTHWLAANCLALRTVSSETEDEGVNVQLVQQLLRLLYLSTISHGPSLQLTLLEEIEAGDVFLGQLFGRLDRTLLLSTIPIRSPIDDKWQADIEQAVVNATLSTVGADGLEIDTSYNEQAGHLALRTILLHARSHTEAGAYLQSGRVSSGVLLCVGFVECEFAEFGSASAPLLQAHARAIQATPALRDCVEYRTLTLHGYIPLGVTPTAWFFANDDGVHFCYSPRTQQFWREGIQLVREDLLSKCAANLPYM